MLLAPIVGNLYTHMRACEEDHARERGVRDATPAWHVPCMLITGSSTSLLAKGSPMFRTLSIAALALAASTTLASADVQLDFASVTFDGGRATVTATGGATVDTTSGIPVATTPLAAVLPNSSSVVTSLKLGGGLNFSEGMNYIDLANIVIDTSNNLFVADVNLNGVTTAGVTLFTFNQSLFGQTISSLIGRQFSFAFTSTGAADFNAGLGLTGGNVAKPGKLGGLLEVVPEPAAFGILGLGLALVAAGRRRA